MARGFLAHQTSLALNRLDSTPGRRTHAPPDAGGALPDSLVAQIYQRTGGVPLLVEEFIRMVRESGVFGQACEQEIPRNASATGDGET